MNNLNGQKQLLKIFKWGRLVFRASSVGDARKDVKENYFSQFTFKVIKQAIIVTVRRYNKCHTSSEL